MRVTERSRAAMQQAQLQRTTTALAATSDSISSGIRIQRDSQDSVAAATARRARAAAERRQGFLEANRRATQQLQTSEEILGLGEGILLRTLELAVQGATGSYSSDQRGFMASEVAGLRNSLVQVINTRERGAYLFGGQREDVAPVDATGTYVGSGPPRVIPVEATTTVALLSGDEAFGPPGGSVLDDLDALVAALSSGTAPDVSATLDALRGSLTRLTDARSQIGARQQVAEQAQAFDEALLFVSRVEESSALDTDYLSAIPLLQRQQQALEASLRIQRIASDTTLRLFR
jgi:flagellar hook-associated protein 3 FlgL